jgi:cytidylate kinase
MMQIAIDGPSAAGKSTLAKLIANQLGIYYLDTGAMYRACGLHMRQHDVDLEDEAAVLAALPAMDMQVVFGDQGQRMYLDGQDVSERIREQDASDASSRVSRYEAVRRKLVDMQREIARTQPIVMDGRDIGTVVMPQARYKFFLTAPSETRARRRYLELLEKGGASSYKEVLAEVVSRDERDTKRAHSPLKKARDAIEIDSSDLTAQEVAQVILTIIASHEGGV